MFPLRDVIPSRTFPAVTIALIVANAAVWLYELTLPAEAVSDLLAAYGVVPARFHPTAVVTSMFLHGGWFHVIGNMWFLWIFGDNVEDRMGHGRFLAFYLLCGVGAALAQSALSPDSLVPMVGASGAIAGVMGAYFVLYPRSRVLTLLPFPLMVIEVPAVFLLGLWFVIQFVNGLGSLVPAAEGQLAGGVAFWAHIVGFGVGVVLVFLFRRPERQRVDWWGGPAL